MFAKAKKPGKFGGMMCLGLAACLFLDQANTQGLITAVATGTYTFWKHNYNGSSETLENPYIFTIPSNITVFSYAFSEGEASTLFGLLPIMLILFIALGYFIIKGAKHG